MARELAVRESLEECQRDCLFLPRLERVDAGSDRARIGSGAEPIVSEPAVRVVNLSGLNGNVRNIAAMEVPATLLGKDRLKPDDTIALSCTFYTHCRAYRIDWKGTFTLSTEP